MTAGKTLVELMKSRDERVRLEAAKYYAARRMGWKETNVNEHVGKDGGPIETKDVSAIDVIRARISGASSRRANALPQQNAHSQQAIRHRCRRS
jgi:hypothetical protein